MLNTRTTAAALGATALFARLLVVRVLFELTEQTAGLKLQVEPLQRGVDRFVIVHTDVDQLGRSSRKKTLYHRLARTWGSGHFIVLD